MEKFYDLNRVFLCQFVVSDFSDDYAESKGKEEYWQLFYMENDGVFRDLFFDRYIPSISSGYHKLSMLDYSDSRITISGLSKLASFSFYLTDEEILSHHITGKRLLEIYLKINKLDRNYDIEENKIEVLESEGIIDLNHYKQRRLMNGRRDDK